MDSPAGDDLALRHFIFVTLATTGRPPTAAAAAAAFGLTPAAAAAAFRRLHDGHFIFLEPGTVDIRMANPFSAVPTAYTVHSGGVNYWANCAWDLLGIPAALAADAELEAVTADTGESVRAKVENGRLGDFPGVVHFPLPFKAWYDDLVLT